MFYGEEDAFNIFVSVPLTVRRSTSVITSLSCVIKVTLGFMSQTKSLWELVFLLYISEKYISTVTNTSRSDCLAVRCESRRGLKASLKMPSFMLNISAISVHFNIYNQCLQCKTVQMCVLFSHLYYSLNALPSSITIQDRPKTT